MAAPTERVFFASPIATGGGRVIASPFQFWTSGEDNLRVVSVNALSGVSLKVQWRGIDPAGVISPTSADHTPASDRTAVTTEYPLGVGAILNLVVFARTGTPQVGQTFVIVQLIRGRGAAALVLGTLLQGYVTSTQVLAWPGSAIVTSTDGEPAVRALVGTAPAAGSSILETVPTGARWELLTLQHSVTGAPLVEVPLTFYVTIGVDAYVQTNAQQPTHAGEVSQDFTWAAGYVTPSTTPATRVGSSIPAGLRLPAGTLFGVANFSAAHTMSAPRLLVREWLEVP